MHDKAFERRSRSDCVHEQVAKRIANVRFTLGPKYLLTRKILKNERTSVFSDPHAQGNPFLLHIHADHLYFYDISNAYNLERMFDKLLVRQLRDMHQSILM